SEALYQVAEWGRGRFSIGSNGNVQVTPEGPDSPAIDLHEVVQLLKEHGLDAPILLRFDALLHTRVRELNQAFQHAIKEYDYGATYRGVFPIKVNQDRWVVESLLAAGREFGMGLEVGSKPELLAGIALLRDAGSLMICNGYKDQQYVEMALLSTRIGLHPIIVIEKYTELETILKASQRLGLRPSIGVRTKLSVRGEGRWKASVGDRSKFGLTTRELVHLVETLEARGMLDCLELLHLHIGSQIPHIRSIKNAMREATQTLVGLSRMGVNIRWFDAGGGLGVDYDGSKTNYESSKNYSVQEYANDVVWHLHEACQTAGIKPPTIVTESGRALAAHHAVLITEVIGVSNFEGARPAEDGASAPDIVKMFSDLRSDLTAKNYVECYHDAIELRDEAMLLFNTGQLALPDRARIEESYWSICREVLRITRTLDHVPEDLEHIEREFSDTYFLNFSLFQSIPDAWAIGQLFPVLPIHRHHEEPKRRAVLADLTCDSDGKIDRFIDAREVKRTLELHEVREGEPYYIGFFLVGAYQEILGDMHNLFGDTHIAHVDLDAAGRPALTHVRPGDSVKTVLSFVQYAEEDLLAGLRGHIERAIQSGGMSCDEATLFTTRYEESLRGYTYLTRPAAAGESPTPETEGPTSEDPARLPG
ncbi:MAG: arginine decarboxylase, partial [Gammaproteobacteria bacterium]